MTQIKAVAEVIESKMDVYGNIYNFVCVTNTLTGARALGHFSGNYSNIEHALKDFIDIGFDIINPLQPKINNIY